MFQLLEVCPGLFPTSLWRAKLSSSSFTTGGMLITMTRDNFGVRALCQRQGGPLLPVPTQDLDEGG